MGVLGECLMLLILTKEMLLHEFFFLAPIANEWGMGHLNLGSSWWEEPGNSTKLQ